MNKEQEIWKPVVGFEGLYEVSSCGRVRSVERVITYSDGRKFQYKQHILKLRDNRGYRYVNLPRHHKVNMKKVHRLVADAFIPNPQNKPHVDHINGDRTDNRVENLRWATAKENRNNPVTIQRFSESFSFDSRKKIITTRQANNRKTAPKSIVQCNACGDVLAKYNSITDASMDNHIDLSSIAKCCRGVQKTAGGYIWRYADEDNNNKTK